jgi:hypothetical protein
MDAAEAGKTHSTLRHALAGLQAGVSGALLMMVWSAVAALWSGRSIWTIPNLYATTLYGSDAYVNGLARSSWSGLALMIVVCGTGGIVWGIFRGIVWEDRRPPFPLIMGAAVGWGFFFLLFRVVLSRVNPLIPLYAPEPQAQIGYILWGLALGRFRPARR